VNNLADRYLVNMYPIDNAKLSGNIIFAVSNNFSGRSLNFINFVDCRLQQTVTRTIAHKYGTFKFTVTAYSQ
jgi:hypothetical protein